MCIIELDTFLRRHSSQARDTFDRFLGAVSSLEKDAGSCPESFIPRGTVRGETGCLMSWLVGVIPIIGDDNMGGSPRDRLPSCVVNCICPDWVQCGGNVEVVLPLPVPEGLEEGEYGGSTATGGRFSTSNCSGCSRVLCAGCCESCNCCASGVGADTEERRGGGLDTVEAAIEGPVAEVCGGFTVATSAIAIQLCMLQPFKALLPWSGRVVRKNTLG